MPVPPARADPRPRAGAVAGQRRADQPRRGDFRVDRDDRVVGKVRPRRERRRIACQRFARDVLGAQTGLERSGARAHSSAPRRMCRSTRRSTGTSSVPPVMNVLRRALGQPLDAARDANRRRRARRRSGRGRGCGAFPTRVTAEGAEEGQVEVRRVELDCAAARGWLDPSTDGPAELPRICRSVVPRAMRSTPPKRPAGSEPKGPGAPRSVST